MSKTKIQLLVPFEIRGKKHARGTNVTVSKWVARALLNSKPPRAMLPELATKPAAPPVVKKSVVKGESPKKVPRRVSVEELEEMRKNGAPFKAARKLMKTSYGVTASGWDELLVKARKILAS